MMVLVDTSIWIDLFRERDTPAAARLQRILDEERPFAVTPVIVQEVLQGAADEREFALLYEYFTTQRMLLSLDPTQTHTQAARLYFDCRRRGFTPRSTVDCLIAQIAIDHGAVLLHNDQDFARIAKVARQLKFA
jgi:predicted nucleic acid-binding protein